MRGLIMESLQQVQKMIVYLEDHLYQNVTIDELGDHIGETPFHCHQTFTMICGMNIEEYILKRRMTEAAQRVITGNERLVDIANDFGYPNANRFSHEFSEYHGMSPVKARMQQDELKLMNRLYVKYAVTEQPPLAYLTGHHHEVRLAGYRVTLSNHQLMNHFLIPDTLFNAKEKGQLEMLKSIQPNMPLYVSVHPFVDGVEIFYGVPHNGKTNLDTEYIKHDTFAIFTLQGNIDYLLNEVWHSIEQQISISLPYVKNDYYFAQLPLNLDFDQDFTKMTFYLPIKYINE